MDSANLLTKRHWIVELARRKPGGVLYSLHHVVDFEWMREAYWLTRKDGATGIDGVTAADYEANLEANLRIIRADQLYHLSFRCARQQRTALDRNRVLPPHIAESAGYRSRAL